MKKEIILVLILIGFLAISVSLAFTLAVSIGIDSSEIDKNYAPNSIISAENFSMIFANPSLADWASFNPTFTSSLSTLGVVNVRTCISIPLRSIALWCDAGAMHVPAALSRRALHLRLHTKVRYSDGTVHHSSNAADHSNADRHLVGDVHRHPVAPGRLYDLLHLEPGGAG